MLPIQRRHDRRRGASRLPDDAVHRGLTVRSASGQAEMAECRALEQLLKARGVVSVAKKQLGVGL